ncbi:MAG TPA: enoyl-CoA hydratase/isomerase family protein [Kofleriaceae bacterium]|nr:enoyl-CoA hydratase/isomerase family protein [Kofleriaceae bacterium]
MPAVDVERRGAVALLTLNNPPANALGTPVLTALAEAIEALAADDARAVVVTGAGRFFSAGLDLFEVAKLVGSPDAEAFARRFDGLVTGLFALEKPVVAAINGHAIAGGAVLAATADFRLVADAELKIGVTEIQVGVVYPTSALEVVRFACAGPHLAELLYRGNTYGPADAVVRRLADEVVPAGELLDRALALAAELGEHRPLAFASSKRALRAEHLARIRAASGGGIDPVWRTWQTPDAMQAIFAYRERTLKKKSGG